MAGEAKRTYAAKELDAGSKKLEEGSTREQYIEKRQRGSPEHYSNGTVESRLARNGAKFIDKDRESTQQREAVIRPQQAGKIDFKSLQNRPKFTSNSRPWPGGKGSPQSPSGKSRSRDKSKKSSKSDRGTPQQLYRLSISNPRSNNPTIGIAYPQQKVSPPKKLETGRGLVSGSYRFHVPSIPEREAELQQEDRNYARCFPEGPSNLTSQSYTSQVVVGSSGGTPAPQHSTSTQQQQQQPQQQQQQPPSQPPGPLDASGPQPTSQMLFSDFQLNGTDAWQSPERTLTGANYGITAQKNNVVVEPNKVGFMPMPFQYGFPLLEDSATDAFPCDQNAPSQDYMDASLAPHNPFAFQPSAEGQEAGQSAGSQFSSEQSDDRPPYPLSSQPQPYLPIPHGPPSSMHCPRGMGDEPGLGESSVPEQSKGAVTDKMDSTAISGGKRNCHLKDSGATATLNQGVLIQSNVHHIRNIAQGPGSQMHFPGKAYSNSTLSAVHMGPMPHDKNVSKSHSRGPQPWEGQNKTCPPIEQSSLAYANLPEKYPFQCQPAHDQRQGPGKNNRMSWQQIRLSAAMPNQNRIELSRQLSNQKLTFVITPSEWQDEEKLHKGGPLKSPGTFQSKRPTEGYSNQRQESIKQTCSAGMPPCPYKNKTETAGHVQVCDAKNKSLYFGMNQSIPGASTRACNYPPPMQVPPMGMMLVSPYESPLPSPTQNPASSSTCSSLSPASTSPVNSSSDDGQISKPVGPPPFYHQPQGKVLTSADHLNSNHHHFHVDTSRNLPYPTERPKEDMISFMQNNRTHTKSNMESSKGCMDNFGMEHHPPPPYSAHQLLATSLATANLDQLDVLLTCKQCDQNFNNLVSFLEHKQYCGQHAFAQNDLSNISKEDSKKALAPGTGYSQMSRCPSDLHLSLLGLSKNGEIIPDTDAKVDPKDDPLKLNLFSGGNNPPACLPDLEMEDAKLDSLITEALNGLGYQSDNAEIDSSFIDAFGDDDLTTAKCTSNRQTLKTKDCVMFESRTKHEASASERSYTGKCSYDSDIDSHSTDSKLTESSNTESQTLEQSDDTNSKESTSSPESISVSSLDKEHKQWMKETRKTETTLEESSGNPRFVLSKKFSERCGIKSVQESSLFVKSSVPQSPSGNRTSTQRLNAREGKRKRTGGGTWSKELIHKIVQQKNKLHKLHVKGTKNMQFSLVMERLTPTVQTPTFREYDYVSDSDEDCEPLKIAGKGRLSQSIRCKYTYTKECKGRARSEKSRELPWKQDKNDCFDSKKVDDMSLSPVKERLRRRSSRSSTSSELSTSVSISSDSISSPKSTDGTDSDSERKTDMKRKDSDSFEQNVERSPHRVRREANTSVALSFSKNTKRYSTEKILLSANKEDSTTTKCSSNSSRNTEIVSELTKTRSVFRFKSTEVSASVAKEDLFSCETGVMARTEESTCHTKESHKTSSSSKHYSAEVLSIKHKKDDSSSKVKPPTHKLKDENISDVILQQSDIPKDGFDRLTHGVHGIGKELGNFHTDLVKKPPSLCNVLIEEVCLSPTNLQDVTVQKDSMRHSLMPCPLEQDQSLLKSPLSFDTSSMFGDLTVAGFDNNLYPEIQLNKDSFSPLEPTSDKKEMFESSFSPFLEQRDWGLMVDVTPELPDEISQYKDDSDAESEKKTNFGAVPFSLPDKIMNYSTGLNSCVSEDELEIKRIVTELESQLQTNKLSTSPLLEEELPKQLTMSKFSPLRLDQEADNEQSGMDVDCTGENLALTAPSLPTDPHSEGFSEPDMPWASPLQFGLAETQHCLHTPTHSITHTHGTLSDKVGTSSDLLVVEKVDHPGTTHKSEGHGHIKSEEMLENEMYKENLMKSLEVISDSIFKKDVLPLPMQESKQSSPENSENSCQKINNGLMPDNTTPETEKERSEKQSEVLCVAPHSVRADCEVAEEVDTIKSNDSSENPVTQNNTDATESSQMRQFHHLASQLHDPQNPEEIGEHRNSKALTRHQDSSESPKLLFPTTVQYEQEQPNERCNWAGGQLEQEKVELNSKLNADQTSTEDAPKDSEVSLSCHGKPSVNEAEEKSKESVEEGCLTASKLMERESVTEEDKEVITNTNTVVHPACSLSQEEDKPHKTENIADEHPGTQMTDAAAESTRNASPQISITEHFSGAYTSHVMDPIKDTDIETSEEITSNLPDKIPEDPEYQDSLVQPTLTIVALPLNSPCTDESHEEDTSKHLAMPPLSPCLPDSSTEENRSPVLHIKDTELNSQPTQHTKVPSEEENKLQCTKDSLVSEPSIDKPIAAAVGLDLPCVPQLDFEMPKSEMSISDNMVCHSNSNLIVPSTTEAFPIKDSVYDLKLSPLSYKEVSDNQEAFHYNFTTPEYTCIKTSPKSDGNHSNTDLLLPSNELSTANDEQELKLSADQNKLETVKMQSITLQNRHIENNNKCSYSGVMCSRQQECITTSKVHVSKMENCHVALETIDFMDFHQGLLKKTDSESLDSIRISTDDVSFNLRESHAISSNKKVLQSQGDTTTESSSTSIVPSSQTEEGFVTKHSEAKSSSKKNSSSHTGQGNFQCEICSMYFRTLPGLKRHKAMKHVVKTTVSQSTSNRTVYQLTVPVQKDTQPINILNIQSLQAQDSGQSLNVEETVISETTANDLNNSAESNTKDKTGALTMEKARKNGKAWNNKNSEVSGGSYSFNIVKVDPFPEELLSMLDTELLNSIPSDIPSVSDVVEKLSMESDNNDHKFTSLPTETCNIEKQDLLACESDSLHNGLKSSVPSEESNITKINDLTLGESEIVGLSGKQEACNTKTRYAQTASAQQENKNADLQQKSETEIKSENINEPIENADLLVYSFKDPPASSSGLGPDLNALLDDESTFSQLFPRTEEMKRKKCPRVYGKSNKKQKVAPNVPAVPDHPPTDVFLDSREDYKENKTGKMFVNSVSACEFNMTIDDAIMLDMCHEDVMKGSAEKDCHSDNMMKEKSYVGGTDHGMNTFLCSTEDIISKVAVALESSKAAENTDPLVSPDVESCKSELTDTFHSAPPCVQENVSHFPSIDIQNLNTTFQLPEIQFFDPSKDIPIVGNIINEEDVLQSLPTESEKPVKKPTERKGRKRGEAGLKPKDKQYKCKVCFTWFLTLGELNFHKLSHNPSPPPTCYMCVQRKFSSREQLRDHLREKHAKNKAGMWSCGMCLKEISDVWMYNEHLREHATQFARKGQTQSSLLDMPGCFMQENAVKNFITSIMQHQTSKSTRGDSAKSSSREDRRATPDTTGQDTKTEDDGDLTVTKTKSSGGSKHSSFTPLEVLKAEIAPKNVEMHPNCKDPSRDCHHCGKQFPKPFKLQRHLVVHSLQKIFLCHKCPVSYQESKELKDHLKNEHEEVDESDSKHTTLYTCELCADVMHVIKKSFICSTCNYIFSKKEQYDRHMEKHLAGGNKIFKFKGVLRPCKPTVSKDDGFNSPPNKKRKILPENLQENSSDSGIASVASCHLGQSIELEVFKPTMLDPMRCSNVDEHPRETSDTDVKMEDEIVNEIKEHEFNIDSAVQTSPQKAIPKTEDCDDMPHMEPAQEANNNGKGEKCMTVNCDVKEEENPLATPKLPVSPETVAKHNSVTEDRRDCTSEPKQCFSQTSNIQDSLKGADHNKSEVRGEESSNFSSCTPQSEKPDISQPHNQPHKESLSCSPKLINEQVREEKANDPPAFAKSCDSESKDPPSASGTEQFVTLQVREKATSRVGENHKHSSGTSPRALASVATEVSPVNHSKIATLTSPSNEEKESAKLQKKRKETKVAHTSQKTSSTVARENLGIDSRAKKKFRPGKAELPSGLKKPEASGDYPVLSSVKDDIVSNKIVSKHRAGTLGLQLKRGSIDNYPSKKAEIVRHLNVDFKGKRLGPGRPVQSPTSKVSVSSLSNSLNKSKPKAGVRSVDTQSYRTAESQNNLLSQLFGQKLTSFKIPLRKDTSESIN